jgi:hypothetical protein
MTPYSFSVSSFFDFLNQNNPIINAIEALLLLLIGSFIARIISKGVGAGIRKTKIDEKLNGAKLSLFFEKLIYILLMIMVLMASLELLGISNVLNPLNQMMVNFMSYVPNLIAAVLVFYIGYLLAKMVSDLIESVGGKIQEIAVNKMKISPNINVVSVLKNVIFIVIMFVVTTAAADTLQIESVSDPLREILTIVASYLVKIGGAILLVIVFAYTARFISNMLNELMTNFNIDMFAQMMGISKMMGGISITMIVSKLSFFFITYFGILEVVDILGFEPLTIILNDLLHVIGKILMGLLILLIGNFIANKVSKNLGKNEEDKFVASVAKMAILALFLSIGLTQMDLGASIVNLAFGLILGAVALAIGLSYGLGGQAAAGEHMRELIDRFRKNTTSEKDKK